MDAQSVALFESRASEAEARLAALEAHLGGSRGDAEFRALIVGQLLELRTKLGAAQHEYNVVVEERDAALAKVKTLEASNLKLEYRAKHLVKALQESDAVHGAPVAPAVQPFATYQEGVLKKGKVVA